MTISACAILPWKMSSPASEDSVTVAILQDLSHTAYACSSLTKLSGGAVNYVYRGTLQSGLNVGDNAVDSVIVKHSKPHLAGNEGFLLDVSRAECEADALNRLEALSSEPTTSVRTPRCYFFDKSSHIAVLEDIGPDAVDIKTVLTTPSRNDRLTQTTATSIGHQLGLWLRQFHTGRLTATQKGGDVPLMLDSSSNAEVRKLKYDINYGAFIEILAKFPEATMEVNIDTMRKIQEMANKEASSLGDKGVAENCGQVHGDFWMGNVLLNDALSLSANSGSPNSPQPQITIIDWEFTQINHFSYDTGRMLGDLLERHLLNHVRSAIWILRGFAKGYNYDGDLDPDLLFRSVIHAGVHLMGWYNRRAPWQELSGTEDQKIALVNMAVKLIEKGWEKDVAWLRGSRLADLFH